MNVVGRIGLALAGVSLLVSGCSSAAGSASKAGPDTAPVTLHVATNDSADEPVAKMIAAFASQVKDLSGGTITIEPAFTAAGPGADWDQRNARLVVDGTMEMGLIPSRAWDTEGVTSLRAINAPFLITSDALTSKVVQNDVATTLMSGLDKAGVTGLAMFPEGLRHPFSFGAPLTSPEAFSGKVIRSATSKTVRAVLAQLGATSNDDETNPQIHDGVEASYAVAPPATATGNVTFFPKVDVLVINSKVLADLSESQRQVLQKAAVAARDSLLGKERSDAELAADYCTNGGAVVLATPEQVASLEDALAPVYDELNKDETTRTAIEAIRGLKDQSQDNGSVLPCGTPVDQKASDSSASAVPTVDPSVLNGVYRLELTDEDIKSVGWNQPSVIAENHGTFTWTLKDGAFCWRQKSENTAVNSEDCGTYATTADTLTLTYPDGAHEVFTWTKASNGDLTMVVKEKIDHLTDAMAIHPWVRIGDAG